jgi:hypothetical protein
MIQQQQRMRVLPIGLPGIRDMFGGTHIDVDDSSMEHIQNDEDYKLFRGE